MKKISKLTWANILIAFTFVGGTVFYFCEYPPELDQWYVRLDPPVKTNPSKAVEVAKNEDYAPIKKFPLKEDWRKTLEKIPYRSPRQYIKDSVSRRDVYWFNDILLVDEQEEDSISVHTNYYVFLDQGYFEEERSVRTKTKEREWVDEFNEEEEFEKFLDFIKIMEKN